MNFYIENTKKKKHATKARLAVIKDKIEDAKKEGKEDVIIKWDEMYGLHSFLKREGCDIKAHSLTHYKISWEKK